MSEKQKSSTVAGAHLIKDAIKKPVLVFIIPDHSLSLDQLIGSFADSGKISFIICESLSSDQNSQLHVITSINTSLHVQSIQSDPIPRLADNGIGIGAEFHEKVVEVFQRLHSRNEYEGTGTGLVTVKKFSKIWAEKSG